MIAAEKFFRCRSCGGNFCESIKVLYGENGIEICEHCWEEINEGLRKAPQPNKETV